MVRAMLSKSLIQFSVDGQGCVPSLLFGPNYGRGNDGNGDLLQMKKRIEEPGGLQSMGSQRAIRE